LKNEIDLGKLKMKIENQNSFIIPREVENENQNSFL